MLAVMAMKEKEQHLDEYYKSDIVKQVNICAATTKVELALLMYPHRQHIGG